MAVVRQFRLLLWKNYLQQVSWKSFMLSVYVLIRCKHCVQLWTVRDGYIYRTTGLGDCSLSYSLMQHHKYSKVSDSMFSVSEYIEQRLWNCLTPVIFSVSALLLPLLFKQHSHTLRVLFWRKCCIQTTFFMYLPFDLDGNHYYTGIYTHWHVARKRLDHFCLQNCLISLSYTFNKLLEAAAISRSTAFQRCSIKMRSGDCGGH